MYYFKFADIGEGLHEGKVTQILVKEGDQIKDGDALFEVETDKVTSEITSPVNGKIFKIKIAVDQTVHVGEVVFVIDDGSGPEDPSQENPAHEAPAPAVETAPVSASQPAPVASVEPTTTISADVVISPLAKKIATANSIDVTGLQGSGPHNRIMSADLSQQPAPLSTPTVATQPTPVVQPTKLGTHPVAAREKTSSLRQVIAKNLKQSWEKVAYVTQVVEADVTNLVELRSQYKEMVLKTTGVKLTFLPFIARATALALQQFPIFTSQYDEATQELVYPGTLNLGIAVDTDYGLLVPNIKDAHTKSVLQLAADITTLAKKARARELKGADMSNGHFTITNYGSAGAIFGMPVIKFPEMAILGVGTIVTRVLADHQEHHFMYLTVAADHRWADGVEIATFASTIKKYLENPSLLGIF
ncbi:pyruvate dehydrogenase E2 component (dihydrolipoamide acetyltransferase) [Mycoplasmoides fastidiosum]|uniref:Dihydrolipoamide acetyltransferase component of pyruvate dehydrogenase complex n=1 Tax=Mycoplasmoides fastidiosum TaxID=92758 RepID=A0ABU0LYZ9_9BACT|nr:dihydrolipoamide acetyltransferase family protein [Mycoplasmoides fastidiosum]MDQ0513918.1 pyruvate dehydrogenase E2 component (dihydrolipoamide acetyltransferase) [Mycoplasmoides fastidiosum]UUD37668.1 2-oxo acid dehydrogenase subunit E2 [Mycoplasmoides fastidiosum]